MLLEGNFSHLAHEKFEATCVGLNYFKAADFCYYATASWLAGCCAYPLLEAGWFIPHQAGLQLLLAQAVSPGSSAAVLSCPGAAQGCLQEAAPSATPQPTPRG